METKIRKGEKAFYGDKMFTRGLSRCGHFTIKEAQILQDYGYTLEGLMNGSLVATNKEEKQFIKEMHGVGETTLYLVNLWTKYLNAIKASKSFIGFSNRPPKLEGHIIEQVDQDSYELV